MKFASKSNMHRHMDRQHRDVVFDYYRTERQTAGTSKKQNDVAQVVTGPGSDALHNRNEDTGSALALQQVKVSLTC